MNRILLVAALVSIAGCSSKPVLPTAKAVKVGREDASKNCKEIGPVSGATKSVKGSAEEALQDMIDDAANRGADYLKVLDYSANRTAVRGIAYSCP